jgi:hypothetical protein
MVLDAPGGSTAVPAFSLQGMDFAFLLATVVGFYAMHRLSFVVEGEAVSRSVVVRNLFEEIKRPIVTFSDGDQSTVLALPMSALRSTQRQMGRFSSLTNNDRFGFR